jgi:flagellar basal-body rod protein FlgG
VSSVTGANFELLVKGTGSTFSGNVPEIDYRLQAQTTGANGGYGIQASSATQLTLFNLPSYGNLASINPSGLEPKGGNLYTENGASGTPTVGVPGLNGLGTVQQGYVETSNVNVVEELVQMIQTQRAYELNSKAIQTSDQMLQKLAQL